jgi:hypothetical protein
MIRTSSFNFEARSDRSVPEKMWLIHQFDSLVNLSVCKEYSSMAKARTAGNGNSPKKRVLTMSAVPNIPGMSRDSSPTDLESEIRRRAYELYERRGCTPGHEHEDWLMAEREVVERYQHQEA